VPEDSLEPRFRWRSVRSRPPTHRLLLRAFLALVPLVLVLGAALPAAPAGAATKCGIEVLNDWFDNGRIDKIYPLNCYEEGIDAIPPDLVDYANADEVITRALQSALRGEKAPGGCDPSPDGSGDDCKNLGGGKGRPGGGEDPPQVAPPIDTAGTSSVPIPLLVLGGMSLALLAAGGLGYLSRRRRAVDELDGHDDPPA